VGAALDGTLLASSGPRRVLPRVLALVALVGWTVVLGTPLLEPAAPFARAGLNALRSGAGLLGLGGRLAAWAGLEMVRFAPLGALAVLVLGLPGASGGRPRGSGLRALGLSFAAGLAALVLSEHAAPGPFDAILPGAGVALGWAGARALRRGPGAALRFAAGIAATLAAVAGGLAVLGWLALEKQARVADPAPITSAQKRDLVSTLRGKNPRGIPPGKLRTLRLTGDQVERLAAWASSVQVHGRTAVRLDGPGRASGTVSLRVPATGSRWLNVDASVQLRVERGRFELVLPELRVGPWPVPRFLRERIPPALLAAIRSDDRTGRMLEAIREVRLEEDAVTATYGRIEQERGALAALVWGEDEVEVVRANLDAYLDRLLEAMAASPPGDARFRAGLEAASALALARARSRSRGGSAVAENRAALLTVGVVLGSERLASVLGAALDEPTAAKVRALREGTTVRGRGDWVRHFAVSAALTVLSSVSPSNAAGLLKEELDAGGGSGFSFGDLLADRAGTTFAEVSTRSEATAAAMQERVARGVAVEDVFPAAADLPEGIEDQELQGRYGGVGGPLYRELAAEIERRIAGAAVYRQDVAAGGG
jgi:hypothetical protein